jgi:hypothetical protein
MYFAPRRRGSGWARSNKQRVAALERDGQMIDAGRRVVAAAQADGSWTLLDDVEDLWCRRIWRPRSMRCPAPGGTGTGSRRGRGARC